MCHFLSSIHRYYYVIYRVYYYQTGGRTTRATGSRSPTCPTAASSDWSCTRAPSCCTSPGTLWITGWRAWGGAGWGSTATARRTSCGQLWATSVSQPKIAMQQQQWNHSSYHKRLREVGGIMALAAKETQKLWNYLDSCGFINYIFKCISNKSLHSFSVG